MKEKNRGGVRQRLSDYIKKNEGDLLTSGDLDFSLEAFGNSSVFIRGVKRILKYTAEEMILRAKDFDIIISGRNLNCDVYHLGGIEITGRVSSINFEDGEGL